jgi:transcriptional regulator with XRE-family HTH domain
VTAAEAIRHIRKRLGKNQVEFGQILRCQHNTVSRYERGRLAPSPYVLIALLDLADDPEEKRALTRQLDDYSRRGIIGGASVEQFIEAVKPRVGEIELSWQLMALVPPSKRGDFGQFISAVARIIESCPTVDASIPEILQLWAAHRERPQTAAVLRDALGFLRKMLWGTGSTDS